MSTQTRAASLEIVTTLNALLPQGKQLSPTDARFFEAVLVVALKDERFQVAAATSTRDQFCDQVAPLIPAIMRSVLNRQEDLANRFWSSDSFRAVVEGSL